MSETLHTTRLEAEDLLARARAGDKAAWDELFFFCNEKLRRVVRRKLNATSQRKFSSPMRSLYDSTDFAGNVWKSLFANFERLEFPSIDSLIAFLKDVAEKKVSDGYRREFAKKRDAGRTRPLEVSHHGETKSRHLVSPDPTPSQIAQAHETYERISSPLAASEQEVVELRRQGYSNVEIAHQTGWHVRQVQRFLKELSDSSEAPGGVG